MEKPQGAREDEHDEDKPKHKRNLREHHGKHGKHGKKGPEPPVGKSVKCVLKQSFMDEKSVPAHCVHSAKRFDMFLKLHHPSKVVVMMSPPIDYRGLAMVGFLLQLILLCFLIRCCCLVAKRIRNKRCPVHQQQTATPAQIVLGQPVVLTSTDATAKI